MLVPGESGYDLDFISETCPTLTLQKAKKCEASNKSYIIEEKSFVENLSTPTIIGVVAAALTILVIVAFYCKRKSAERKQKKQENGKFL